MLINIWFIGVCVCVCVVTWAGPCTCGSVSVCSVRMSWDPWWWIRAVTNVLVHLWNEKQGRRGQTEEGPVTLASGLRQTQPTLWPYTHTYTHTHTHKLYPPPPLLPSFLSLSKALHKTELTAALFWETLVVRDTYDHGVKNRRPRMRWKRTKKKEKSGTANTSGEMTKQHCQQYTNSVIYCDVTDGFSSLLCMLQLLQVRHFFGCIVVLQRCKNNCTPISSVMFINVYIWSYDRKRGSEWILWWAECCFEWCTAKYMQWFATHHWSAVKLTGKCKLHWVGLKRDKQTGIFRP